MSRHVADAGAFYTYVARGLGKIPGVGAAFVALISYNAMQIGIYGLFGVATSAFMADKIGITLDWYWWCLIGGAIDRVARRAEDRPQRARSWGSRSSWRSSSSRSSTSRSLADPGPRA